MAASPAPTPMLARKSVRFFQRPYGGYLCLADADLAEWAGEALATSTNKNLEGILRRNWWGFAGRRSADAALHERAGPELLEACRSQASMLDFGMVLTTAAPNLKARFLLHTVVPGHPQSRDPRPMPADRAAEYAPSDAVAEQLLQQSFEGVLQRAAELGARSLCCPAFGCGVRGFPPKVAARIGLNVLADPATPPRVPYVEVRFWDHGVLHAWMQEASESRQLVEVEEMQVREELWQGESLAAWIDKAEAEESACHIA
mmetsp:Transcript_45681/g.102259  ORF Transcript_45681/g.102259 Transcript_45681/m.102259 type:complete len:259 (-) Transcript_45681:140-916(-)